MNEIRGDAYEDSVVCFDCGSSDVVRDIQQQTFQYGEGESAAELTAEMPVYTCRTCGYQFAGPEADDARHEAVCRYLGVLTPTEIVSIRESTGMTRAQFADLTRIGIASLKRWETGVLIQNAANNELIYLMTFPENVGRLQRRNCHELLETRSFDTGSELHQRHRSVIPFRGRSLKADPSLMIRAEKFELRA